MHTRSIDTIKPAPVDQLWKVIEPNIAERAILDLACVIHRRMQQQSSVIAHDEVVLAYSVFEQFGLDGVLEEIAKR